MGSSSTRRTGVARVCLVGLILGWSGVCLGAEAPAQALIATNAAAQTNAFKGVGEASPVVWTILPSSNDDAVCSFIVELKGFSAVSTPEGYVLHIPGEASSADPGTPAVPRIAKLLPGMRDRTAVLTLRGLDPTEVTNVALAATEGYEVDKPANSARHLRPVRRASREIYAQDRFWPPELGSAQEAWIGTQKVVRVECFLIQYNPVRERIRYYRCLEGRVVFKPAGGASSP